MLVKLPSIEAHTLVMSASASASEDPQNAVAVTYLSPLLEKNLRIHISDGRMFVGYVKPRTALQYDRAISPYNAQAIQMHRQRL